MNITTSLNTATIEGNIKSVSDFQEIKRNIDDIVKDNNNLIINITDSLSITSSVIGYLNKLVLKDNINIQMQVANEQLVELLDDLNLISTFHVKKA